VFLFAAEGKYIENGVLNNTGFFDIAQWAGMNVELFFGLNSDGIPEA